MANRYGVSDEELSDYGSEFLDVVDRVANQRVYNATAHLQRQISGVARQALMSAMDAAVPNWRQINDDPDFVRDLSSPQYRTPDGRTQNDILQHAWANNDAQTCINIFRSWSKDVVREHPDGFAYRVPADSASTPVGSGGIVSRAEIEKYYREAAIHPRRYSQEQKDQIEARFMNAARTGRVR